MHTRASSALLVAILLFSGCSHLDAEGPSNRCGSDSDCLSGTCDVERGMCVGSTRTTLTVGIEVLPATDPIYGGSVRPFALEPFEVDEPVEELSLTLMPGIPVSGIVADGLGLPVTADVSFSTSSPIPGLASPTISTQSRSETMRDTRGDGFDYNFATQLLPGRLYDVTVRPTGEWASQLPPLRAMYMSPEADSHRVELRYPEPCSAAVMNDPTSTESCLATIYGFVRNAAGDPVDGVSLRVVDPVTGQTLSSTYTTGSGAEAVAGRFEVTLPVERWRDQEGWLFRLTPTTARLEEHGPQQTFTVAPSALYEDDLGVVTILTPSVPNVVDYAGWVEGPDGMPAIGANLQFVSRDVIDETTGAVGTFTTTATTGGDPERCYGDGRDADCGVFEVALLAGTYDIIITPSQSDPRQARLGVLRVEERRIDPTPPDGILPGEHVPVMGQLFALDRRAAFGGTVRTAGGEGMLNATVRGQALGTTRDGELPLAARYARTNMSITDMNGLFALDLDVGVYDIVIEPPPGSNYPWLVVPDQAIASDATLSNVYELENPVLVTGVAAFENPDEGAAPIPVANGEVRAYAVLETADGSTRAVQIGRASTDADGNYTLLLPPSL